MCLERLTDFLFPHIRHSCAVAMERYLADSVAPHCSVLYGFTAIYVSR